MTDRGLDALVAEKVFDLKPGVDFWDLPEHEFVRCDEGCQSDVGYGESCGLMREMCVRCEDIRTESCDHYRATERCTNEPRQYSTDIAAAWAVVEGMRHKGWSWNASEHETFARFEFRRSLAAADRDDGTISACATYAPIPRLICLAALRALGVEVPA